MVKEGYLASVGTRGCGFKSAYPSEVRPLKLGFFEHPELTELTTKLAGKSHYLGASKEL